MAHKSNAHFPKVLRIDGLVIPLNFSRASTDATADSKDIPSNEEAQVLQETDSEHGHTYAVATLLHDALEPLLKHSEDSELHQRILGMLTEIKDTDISSEEGNRRVHIGLNTQEGQLILKQFKFSPNCTELDALEGKASFDWNTQKMVITDLNLDWMFPSPTTHFELGISMMSINFENLTTTLHPLSYYVFIPEMQAHSYELAPKQVLPLHGISVVIVSSRHYEQHENVLHEIFTSSPVCMKVAGLKIEDY